MIPPRGITALLTASVCFGSSAIFIRLATEASAVSLTFFRLSIAAAVMILFALSRGSLQRLRGRDLSLVLVSGTLLGVHFATFILAVKGTTVANATFLVNTTPVMLAVLSPLMLRERTTSRELHGVIVATIGILLVGRVGNGFGGLGVADFSALLAALFFALYSLAGRRLRTIGMTTACYTAYVYSTAALVSVLLVEFLGVNPFRAYSPLNLFAILGLAVVPTVFGHSLYNYALATVKTVTANLFSLLEPIIASILAAVFFTEIPQLNQAAGYMLILIAVIVVVTKLPEIIEVPS